MKKIHLLYLGLFISMLIISGCSSSGSSSRTAVAPSSTVLPFGIESMTLPVSDDGTMAVDFTYNRQGQLVEGVISVEFDYDNDGSPDEISTTVYTLDPDRSASVIYPEMSANIRAAASLANIVVMGHNPLDSLPGAVLKVEYTLTDSGLEKSAATVLKDHVILTYSYDNMDRLEKLVGMREREGKLQRNTLSYTYDSAGNLTKTMIVLEADNDGSGWVNDEIAEINYSYDDSSRLVEERTYDLGEGEVPTLSEQVNYRYDKFDGQGRIEKITKEEIDYYAGEGITATEIYTYEYTYSDFGLDTYIYADSFEKITCTFVYDPEDGQLLERHEVAESGEDVGDTDIDRYSYDDAGRLVSIENINTRPDLAGENSYNDLTTFTYDENGRLTEWAYKSSYNEVVDEQAIATLTYAASESSAQGTIEFFEPDLLDGTLSPPEPREMLFSFAAGAPTATLDIAVDTGFDEGFGVFNETVVTFPLPGLYAIGYGSMYTGLTNIR